MIVTNKSKSEETPPAAEQVSWRVRRSRKLIFNKNTGLAHYGSIV